MKHKLIERHQDHSLVCDNPKCDFAIPFSEELEKHMTMFIDAPCPDCGENLLTMHDYIQHEKIVRAVNWLNRWFSWITIFYSKKRLQRGSEVSVHCHNGIKIEVKATGKNY